MGNWFGSGDIKTNIFFRKSFIGVLKDGSLSLLLGFLYLFKNLKTPGAGWALILSGLLELFILPITLFIDEITGANFKLSLKLDLYIRKYYIEAQEIIGSEYLQKIRIDAEVLEEYSLKDLKEFFPEVYRIVVQYNIVRNLCFIRLPINDDIALYYTTDTMEVEQYKQYIYSGEFPIGPMEQSFKAWLASRFGGVGNARDFKITNVQIDKILQNVKISSFCDHLCKHHYKILLEEYTSMNRKFYPLLKVGITYNQINMLQGNNISLKQLYNSFPSMYAELILKAEEILSEVDESVSLAEYKITLSSGEDSRDKQIATKALGVRGGIVDSEMMSEEAIIAQKGEELQKSLHNIFIRNKNELFKIALSSLHKKDIPLKSYKQQAHQGMEEEKLLDKSWMQRDLGSIH